MLGSEAWSWRGGYSGLACARVRNRRKFIHHDHRRVAAYGQRQRSVPFATCTHMWRLSHVHFAVAKPRPQQIAKRDRLYSRAHDRRRGPRASNSSASAPAQEPPLPRESPPRLQTCTCMSGVVTVVVAQFLRHYEQIRTLIKHSDLVAGQKTFRRP